MLKRDYGHAKATRCRVFNKHAKRLIKGMKAQAPGFSVKHFEAASPVTKIVMAQAYSRTGAIHAKKFLELLRKKLAFPI